MSRYDSDKTQQQQQQRSSPLLVQHLVVPGQVIAVSSSSSGGGRDDDDAGGGSSSSSSFLRGHGTYVEKAAFDGASQTQGRGDRLVASVTGVVHRVNKLVTVRDGCDSVYRAEVGDLVVGRISGLTSTRWKVCISRGNGGVAGGSTRDAVLPLSGVHLPDGAQRIRTAQDSRNMRTFLEEGDVVCAEVHKIQNNDGTVMLHTRTFQYYGKLQNGCLLVVPPKLVPKRKNHYMDNFLNRFLILFGCNGYIWIQRKMTATEEDPSAGGNDGDGGKKKKNADDNKLAMGHELMTLQEERRRHHAENPMSLEERQSLSRLRNCIECLRISHSYITPESIELVHRRSLSCPSKQQRSQQQRDRNVLQPHEILHPNNVVQLTSRLR